jgi:hypothetical protein
VLESDLRQAGRISAIELGLTERIDDVVVLIQCALNCGE